MKYKRPTKNVYYLGIAKEVAKRGTCLRRNFGAVIVNNDQIISTGYTGSPRGTNNCIDIGSCYRKEMNIPQGERYELCRSVHAEMNAIIHPARSEMLGATLYLVGLQADTGGHVGFASPCKLCKRMIINAGIKRVVVGTSETDVETMNVDDWVTNEEKEIYGDENKY